MKIAYALGEVFGLIIARYFIGYPIFYFGFNYIIKTLNYPQYVIPGFWFGMLCYLIINIFINSFKRIKA